jgi:hypothetical protein
VLWLVVLISIKNRMKNFMKLKCRPAKYLFIAAMAQVNLKVWTYHQHYVPNFNCGHRIIAHLHPKVETSFDFRIIGVTKVTIGYRHRLHHI